MDKHRNILVLILFVVSQFFLSQLNAATNRVVFASPAVVEGNEGYASTYTLADSEYERKITQLGTTIPMHFNGRVRSYIHVYTVKDRNLAERLLGLSAVYFPIFENKLRQYGLPNELKFLPVVESALRTNAVSPAGATGLWQLMKGTAREQYLIVNSYIDERRDPYKSTDAAVRYLQRLYNTYGDWLLVIAAYNCGPGNVNKAIKRAGGKYDFWAIYDYLPRETRNYVPSFMACTYWMSYYYDHSLEIAMPSYPLAYAAFDTVKVGSTLRLEVVAKHLGLSVEELAFLNPALKQKVIPESTYPFCLRLPQKEVWNFKQKRAEILADPANKAVVVSKYDTPTAKYLGSVNLNKDVANRSFNAPKANVKYYAIDEAEVAGKTGIYYEVKEGDMLGYIASWFDCSVSELKRWNDLSSSRLKIGQQLVVFVPEANESRYSRFNELSFAQKQRIVGADSSAVKMNRTNHVNTYATAQNGLKINGFTKVYTVKEGDSLWTIAQSNKGNTMDSIIQLNQINKRTVLQPGMQLLINAQ